MVLFFKRLKSLVTRRTRYPFVKLTNANLASQRETRAQLTIHLGTALTTQLH